MNLVVMSLLLVLGQVLVFLTKPFHSLVCHLAFTLQVKTIACLPALEL